MIITAAVIATDKVLEQKKTSLQRSFFLCRLEMYKMDRKNSRIWKNQAVFCAICYIEIVKADKEIVKKLSR